MEQYSDSELEFIRREICKKYEAQAIAADDIVKEIPQYPKSVGDEKFNFLSEYVERALLLVAQTSGKTFEELDDFRKDNYRINHSLSATLKKLYCEQHYKKVKEERKTERFTLRSINRFYLYFSGKRRNDYWKERGATERNKILCVIQSEIDSFQQKEGTITESVEQIADEKKESPATVLPQIPDKEKYNNAIVLYPPEIAKKSFQFYRVGFVVTAFIVGAFLIYYAAILRSKLDDIQQKLSLLQKKITRTPTKASEEPGLIGTWYSYNRTPETNDENRRKGTIFRGIEWKINADKNGNLVFSRPTANNENEGWIELINMQVNFFRDVHPKFGDKNREQNFGFRHFIYKPNNVDLIKADTQWLLVQSKTSGH
jgi:hypothetical protein